MSPTVSYIQSRFDEYNTRYFGGSLPPVPVRLSHAKGFLGKVTFTRRRQGLFAGYRNENFVLRINARIDLPEELIQDTILHEMIHYYIAVNQLRDTSTHGRLFRHEMARINAEGNRHITISHRLTDTQRAQTTIHKPRVFALVRFSDGQIGIKVVPRQRKHILYWHQTALKTFNKPSNPHSSNTNSQSPITNHQSPITNISWYLSEDDYFAKYPSSVAMRIYLIPDPSDIPLSTAKSLSLTSDFR